MSRASLPVFLMMPLIAALLSVGTAQGAISERAVEVPAATSRQALEILKRSIAFRTVEGQHQVPGYADYLAGVLRTGGFAASDIRIEPLGETASLVARYRGTGHAKPIVISGHMDVVEAKREDWERDPFVPRVENGYIYGRGSFDNKFAVSTIVATLVRLKSEGFRPRRDIVLALSGDEETQMATSRRLAASLKTAELVLNGDVGGGILGEDGSPLVYALQAGEKTYVDFAITITDPGGHSSKPTRTNPIYALARALGRIEAHEFPAQSNELTRAFFRATSARTGGAIGTTMRRYADNPADKDAIATLSADPEYLAQIRTTCVATMIGGGHALNALPQKASAKINCRIFPGVAIEDVKATLVRVIAEPHAKVEILDEPAASDASPLRPDVMKALRKAIDLRYPGLPIVPTMSSGASDSLYYRAQGIPSYGISGIFMKPSDDLSHGLNERAPLATLDGDLAHWHLLLTELAR
jgi:carboxypeptidase PM20D1